MQQFGEILRGHLQRDGAPLRKDFAALLGISAPFITDICAGRRTPPPDKIALMIEALGLSGTEADAFYQAAAEAHMPESMRRILSARLDHLEGECRRARETIAGFLDATEVTEPHKRLILSLISGDHQPADGYDVPGEVLAILAGQRDEALPIRP